MGSLPPRVSLEIALALAEITWKSEQNTPAALRLELIRIDALGGVNLDFEEDEEVTDDGGPRPPSRVDILARLLQSMLSGDQDREKTLDLYPEWGDTSSEIRDFLRLAGHPDRNKQPDLNTTLRTLSGLVEKSQGRALSHWATQHVGAATTRPPLDEGESPERETPIASQPRNKLEDTLPLDKGPQVRRSADPPPETSAKQPRRPGVLLLTTLGVVVGGGITLSVRALNQESVPIPEAVVNLPPPLVGEDLVLPETLPTPNPEPPPRASAPHASAPQAPAPSAAADSPEPLPVPVPLSSPTYTGTILVDASVDITLHCTDGQHTLFQRRTELQLSGEQSCTLTSEEHRGEVTFSGPSRYRCWPEHRAFICGELGQ